MKNLRLVIGIWSSAGAWIFTAINAYTHLWMAGHFHAARLQPVLVDDEYVYLRTGLIWRSQIPLTKIAELRKPTLADSKAPGYLNVSLMGAPETVIVLVEAETVEGLFARKMIGPPREATSAALRRALCHGRIGN